jgi:hypothetical protein
MKLSEFRDFGRLPVSKDIKTPLDTQSFSQYAVPFTGIEVEVENQPPVHPAHSWTVTNDGSLRNSGVEYVSKPTEPKHIESAITYLFDDILQSNAHFSTRTSIHVHLNCRDLQVDQIYNIVILYQCFEDIFYEFAGRERKKSIFCVPVGNTNYYNTTKRFLQAHELPIWSKYTGLNLGPLGEYGTVEFRHLRGTRNKETLFTWLHMLYKLYNFAIAHETKDLEDKIIQTAETRSYFSLGYAVFGSIFVELTRNLNYQKTMAEDIAISKLFMTETNLKEYF